MKKSAPWQSCRFGFRGPWAVVFALAAATVGPAGSRDGAAAAEKPLRVGMIGLDTSHCPAFAEVLNNEQSPQHVPGCRVTLAYPKGSPDIESSVSRVPAYTEKLRGMGVEIVEDLGALAGAVDAVLLETNDGRPHLEQVLPVLRAGKPVFIDKPVAGSLVDAIAIYRLAEHYKVPLFSASSLRFAKATQDVRNGAIGDVTGCDIFGPCTLEPTHPDLFWYGIHGCEALYTVMGTGCTSVVRTHTDDFDQVTGTWSDGRIGTFRGIRRGKGGYGGMAFGTTGNQPVGASEGYRPEIVEIVKFFQTGKPPVSAAETLELFAFMEAADESRRQGGVPVKLRDVMSRAEAEAARKVASIVAPEEPVAQAVTTKIDLLDRVRQGRMEYFINPTAEIHDDAKDVFSFDPDGVFRISGRGYGGMTTLESFKDYRLVIEFKWGEKTWGKRENAARDNGLLLHCRGPQGAAAGNWMASIEAQIIEGGVGDILVLSPQLADGTTLACSVSAEAGIDSNKQTIWSPGADRRTMASGRLNWRHRAADWKDVKGFRGKDDVESPFGEWTRFEIIADGDTLQYFVNGTKVNEAFECKPSQGRILLQTEAAEMFVRRYELHPLAGPRGQ